MSNQSPSLPSILIVDDEKDNVSALTRLLREEFAVTATTSPFEALKWIQQSQFHVIISDQRMPEMTGVELLEKAYHVTPQTSRILLTGYTDVGSIVDAINRAQIFRYIAKPWDPEDLKLTIQKAAETFELTRKLEEKNRQLSAAFAELQKLDQAKARFLGLVSHELKTPLTILQSFASLLNEKDGDLKPAVAGVNKAGQRFEEIINEILLYLQLESATAMNKRPISLLAMVKEAATASGAKLKEVKAGSEQVAADEKYAKSAIQKVIEEILGRAQSDSTIELSLRQRDRQVECELKWSGDAISEQALKPLDPTSDPLNHHKNLGLKLATAKRIFDLHGGELEIVPSRGADSRIRILLPAV